MFPGKTDSQQRVEVSDPKIVATRIRKAQAAAKRNAGQTRGSEGAGGSEGSSQRREEKHDGHSGVLGDRDGNFDDGVDEEVDLEGPDRHV
ncbi:hypothetical protein Tco_0440441, partial [Tanacetum coccineum]